MGTGLYCFPFFSLSDFRTDFLSFLVQATTKLLLAKGAKLDVWSEPGMKLFINSMQPLHLLLCPATVKTKDYSFKGGKYLPSLHLQLCSTARVRAK
jgi:hypothetical protein